MSWIRFGKLYINLDHVYVIKVLKDGTLVLRFPDGYEQELYDAEALFGGKAHPFGSALHVPLMDFYNASEMHRLLSRWLLEVDPDQRDVKRDEAELKRSGKTAFEAGVEPQEREGPRKEERDV